MSEFTWIGVRPTAVCAALKRDLPPLQPWQTAIRISFRFERVYCILNSDKSLVLSNGEAEPVTAVYANGKALLGKNDYLQTGLDYNDDARAFRKALSARARCEPMQSTNPTPIGES